MRVTFRKWPLGQFVSLFNCIFKDPAGQGGGETILVTFEKSVLSVFFHRLVNLH